MRNDSKNMGHFFIYTLIDRNDHLEFRQLSIFIVISVEF